MFATYHCQTWHHPCVPTLLYYDMSAFCRPMLYINQVKQSQTNILFVILLMQILNLKLNLTNTPYQISLTTAATMMMAIMLVIITSPFTSWLLVDAYVMYA